MTSTRLLLAYCIIAVFAGYMVSANIVLHDADEISEEAEWNEVMQEKHGEECYPGADIGIIADRSSSIKISHFKTLKIDLAKLVDRFHVGPNMSRIGIILFGRSADVWLNFTDEQYYSNAAVKQRIRAIPEKLQFHTRTDKALMRANEQLFGDIGLGDRPGRRNYLFVLTDGRPFPENEVAPFNETVPPLEDKDVEIIAVGIGREFNIRDDVLGQIAGKNGHTIVVADYDALAARINEIVSKACDEDGGYSKWSKWSKCSVTCGGGVQIRSRTCTNPPPKGKGKTCEQRKDVLGPAEDTRECNTFACDEEECFPGADIGIIADRSNSIKRKHFRMLKKDLCQLVDRFRIGANDTRMGFILYNRNAELLFNFADTRYYSNDAVKERIDQIPVKLAHQTRIDKALNLANLKLFGNESLGDRPHRPNYLFVFTDGRPYPPQKVAPFSQTIPPLEAQGVEIVSIGIGRTFNIRDEVLYEIAGQNGNVIKVKSFKALADNINRIVSAACDRNGGYNHWSEWTECSVSCGGGVKNRTRACDNPPPRGYGENCDILGPAAEIQACNTHECDQDGNYTRWSDWSECGVTCGGGIIRRSRTCTNPPPKGNGKTCDDLGPAEETKECNAYQCIQPCANAMDVAVAIENSVSVKAANLAKMKTFLQGLVYSFGVSAEETHFATILFARSPIVYFGFAESAYYDRVAIKQKVGEISDKLKYGRNTDKVFVKADKDVFTSDGGDRPDKPNVLLIFTVGNPSGSYQPFSEIVPPLEAKGVTIVAVGIGEDIDKNVLGEMAGQKGHAISVLDFDDLQGRLKEIRDITCSSS